MGTKVKLRNLIIKGFRGARKVIPLNFEDNTKSLVLFGNNGDGKSSFSDAIEWFFTDKIDYLQREGCGRDDYFNRYMPSEDDAMVEINFSNNILNSQKTLKRKGGHSFSNTNNDFREYMRNSLKESFVLRHHTMREFIDKTKKEKLEMVEEIIGFNIVRESRNALLKALNALKDDRQSNLWGQLTEKRRDIVSTIGRDDFRETDVLNYANRVAKQCDSIFSIVNNYDFKSVCETLDKKIKASDKGKELSRLESIDEEVLKLTAIGEFLRKITDILSQHNKLATREETVKASVIEKLYSAAIEAIENRFVKPGECPICKKPVDNTKLLLKSLNDELEEIKKVLKERKQVIQNAKSLSSRVPSYRTNLRVLLKDEIKTKYLTTETSKRLTDIATLLSQYEQILSEIQESPEAVSMPQIFDDLDWQNLEEAVKGIQQRIAQRKKELSETDEEKKFYQNVHKLQKLYKDYIRYKEINKLINCTASDPFKEKIKIICVDRGTELSGF